MTDDLLATQLAAVREVVAAMDGITGARVWAQQLHAALGSTSADPASRPPITWCGASLGTGLGEPLGPCILRHGHDGPVHQDADGAKWWPTDAGTPPGIRPTAEILADPGITDGTVPALGQRAHAAVGAVTRAQLHDAIRTLARLDPKWWRTELGRMARMEGRRRFLGGPR